MTYIAKIHGRYSVKAGTVSGELRRDSDQGERRGRYLLTTQCSALLFICYLAQTFPRLKISQQPLHSVRVFSSIFESLPFETR